MEKKGTIEHKCDTRFIKTIDDQEKQSYHSYPQSWEEVEEAHVEQESCRNSVELPEDNQQFSKEQRTTRIKIKNLTELVKVESAGLL